MSRNLLTLTIGKQKNIALIAHDAKKEELISWCDEHKKLLSKHFLCGTGTTARMITDRTAATGFQNRALFPHLQSQTGSSGLRWNVFSHR